MEFLSVSTLATGDNSVEVVERKGLGHPDTICDALAEMLSRNLCREYRRRFGDIFHHNVDKALLCGGRAAPEFGGGSIQSPIRIYLAGRAVTEVGNEAVGISEIAVEGSRAWLAANLHALDPHKHVVIHELIQPGSQDLQSLFAHHSKGATVLANDTSIGVGYAPMSSLELLVLAIEKRINGRDRNRQHPAWGEDVKVMGVRRGSAVQITVACAMIGRYLPHVDDYLAEKLEIENLVRTLAKEHGLPTCEVGVNTADNHRAGIVYLTVTGTSAEAGDDGQVGRGNRVNGLITPYRPMSLEAAAGKNPISHVGKIYNVVARDIAETVVATVPEVLAAQCLMVSRIGSPVTRPALLDIRIETRNESPIADLRRPIEEVAVDRLAGIPKLVQSLVAGAIDTF
jgi:S-adenosylmethionine synthetase